jgi:hypothetical protein
MLQREQFYIDIIFNNDSYLSSAGDSQAKLNLSPNAGSTLGFKHSEQFKLMRSAGLEN